MSDFGMENGVCYSDMEYLEIDNDFFHLGSTRKCSCYCCETQRLRQSEKGQGLVLAFILFYSVWPNTISIPLLIILPIWKLKWPTAAKKNPVLSLTEISESIGGINISGEDAEVAAPAKNGGRKPAANSKAGKPPAVARKRAPAAAGKQQQKLLTQMLKPTSVAESSGISLEKKLRKIRESPFN
ncbi:hypothetical protein GQ457_12G032250 [Hibiscus cannabinus]